MFPGDYCSKFRGRASGKADSWIGFTASETILVFTVYNMYISVLSQQVFGIMYHVLFRSLGKTGALHNLHISMYFLGQWAFGLRNVAQSCKLLLILLRLNEHFIRRCECFTAEDVELCPQRRPGRRSLGALCTASADDRRSTGDCS